MSGGPADFAGLGPGAAVGGYRLEQRIGRGGMAVVYRAADQRSGRTVALKILAPGLVRDGAFRARFVRESRVAAAVRHPNILPVYDSGEADGYLFIAMRYAPGGDVRTALRGAGRLTAGRAWPILAQVASALDAAHACGLVHRDVKPANMLLTAHSLVYLADFGVSRPMFAERLTSTGQIVGTLDYISPEQLEGHYVDGRADQYSLACSAFELLCGIPPFRRGQGAASIYAQVSEPPPSLAARVPGMPADVDTVLARALAKSRQDRFASCAQFAADLGQALGLGHGHAAGPHGAPLVPPAHPGSTGGRIGVEPPTRRLEP